MTMKNGFSTINRLLGKHRESNSNLSRSSTNLSVTKSTVNINESSQVHQNRITPLPIATSNAPFEQTFRITVLLPRDQLYVARLGAKVLLHKLLQLVCENKQLDPDKYEFQHPADPSQIFSCDLTIGAVGLSEIRLCSKSEYNNTFHSDDVTYRRNSFSSSKFSRNSKIISNTPSLYSSRNSLNSMSSSGIDSNFRNTTTEIASPKHLAPVIPARKKRLAPRPPSQILSLENDAAHQTNASEFPSNNNYNTADTQHPIRNNELVSSSNLGHTLEQRILGTNDLTKSNISIDCNGNTSLQNNGLCIKQCQEKGSEAVETSDVVVSNDTFNSHSSSENVSVLNQPEPSPRRKVQSPVKKSVPVAPPRSTKSPTEKMNEVEPEEKVPRDFTTTTLKVSPVALPRSASSSSLISQPVEQLAINSKNISEIVVNQNQIAERNSILQTPGVRTTPVENINSQSKGSILEDGEEQIDRSWNSSSTQSSEAKRKSFIESSSEDDEMIKVYDLKLGKTIVKTLSNHKTSETLDGIFPNEAKPTDQLKSVSEEGFVKASNVTDDSTRKDDFHDTSIAVATKDNFRDINSSIFQHQEVVSHIESQESLSNSKDENQDNSIIEDKLSQQTEQQAIAQVVNIKCENLPQKPDFKQLVTEKPITEEIEAVKDITIINSENSPQKPELEQIQGVTTLSEGDQSIMEPDVIEKSEAIIDPITNSTQAIIIKQEPLISTLERLVGNENLLDEPHFEASTIQTKPAIQAKPAVQTKLASPIRSSSFLSLNQLESTNQRNYTTDEYFNRRRRSSSELSIGESPSLQSLGVIKSILNSRKNSLCGSEESNRTPPTECDIQSMEEPSPKSNNIIKTSKLNTGEKEKVYRYSGPPNIHFSTWSERPKVQVSIKNEQDCVFDGSKSGSRHSTSTVNRGDSALQRSNQNLKSVPVMSEHLRGNTEKATLKGTNSNDSSGKPLDPSPTSTMPKFIFGNRTSNPWPVASSTSITLVHNNRPQSQPLLRSTSITQTVSNPSITQTKPAFGQGTLRKTGFKEKIVPLQETDVDVSKSIPFALKNQTNLQATPKIAKNSVRMEVPISTVPDAPPPPPIIRAVVTKQKLNNRTQISLAVDPRDQLLSAIRNFKRDELKHANI